MKLHEALKLLFKDVKQASIANKLGVAASTVNQWLNGTEVCGQAHLANIVAEYFEGDKTAKRDELLRLFLLLDIERIDSNDKWTLPENKQLAIEALRHGYDRVSSTVPNPPKKKGRTLCDFPQSFYPLAVVSGDKREESPSRINPADFAVASASPAESRWIFQLGIHAEKGDVGELNEGVEFFTDKVFVLESEKELRKRFSKKNLLVIGSPGSNHLARRCHLANPRLGWRRSAPVFRFNMPNDVLDRIEDFLEGLDELNPRQLIGKKGDRDTEDLLKHWLHDLFSGGIIDPTYKNKWLRGTDLYNIDFGMISLARNPFAENDDYVCILAAGFHMFGTAHALKMLSTPAAFKDHPLGGAIKVNYNTEEPFAKRFDHSVAAWDTKSDYTIPNIIEGLNNLLDNTPTRINITHEEIKDCLDFIANL